MPGSPSALHQVASVIRRATEAEASDIHLEPYEASFRIRFRLDGVLHTVAELPIIQKDAIVSRIKVMAELDIAEKRLPQDGRIRFQSGQRCIDLRVSTLPTRHGEKVVIRILDRSAADHTLDALGLDGQQRAVLNDAIRNPHGIVLVTGPTGSGKTTTLYAALRELNTSVVNILTIEDPIEYDLPGINQSHVRADIGYTFATALRAFLRQDPNIIMVGEIRDAETAEMAVRASLTGHLVLSTLHTNDAPSAVTRLIDMGIEPFLVASSLRLVVAQRLVRKVCPVCCAGASTTLATARCTPIHCIRTGSETQDDDRQAGMPSENGRHPERNARAQRGREVEGSRFDPAAAGPSSSLATARCSPFHCIHTGSETQDDESAPGENVCDHCYGTGYRGRTALFEMMPVSEALADLMGRRAPTREIRHIARTEGMKTLREGGVEKAELGITTMEEVLRETSAVE